MVAYDTAERSWQKVLTSDSFRAEPFALMINNPTNSPAPENPNPVALDGLLALLVEPFGTGFQLRATVAD